MRTQQRGAAATVAASTHPLLQWCRRHPVFTDAGWVLALVALTGADTAHRGSALAIGWLAASWLPVIFRRTAPVVVFVVVGVVAAGQWAFDRPSGGDLAVLIVLYTVAAHRSRILAVAAAAAVEVGVVLAVLRFGQELWPRYLLLLTILVVAAGSLGITQQARRAHLVSLTDRADRLEREGRQQAQLAAAAERTRIAREMHDIVAHSLSVMITLADGAMLTDDPEQARTAMQQVATTGRGALADTRRVLNVLHAESERADFSPLPGMHSLEDLLTSVRATGLQTSLMVAGARFTIPEAAQLAIYRMVQEALTNTLKHAPEATRSTVRISYDVPSIEVEVTDDGKMTDDREPDRRLDRTHGLLGIRERAAMFNGSFAAGRLPTGGWRVAVTLRLPEPAATVAPAESALHSPDPAQVAR